MPSLASFRCFRLRLPAVFFLLASLFAIRGVSIEAQTAVSDPAVPQVIVPSAQGSQFFVLNRDRSVLGASTFSSSTYALRCAATSAIASQAAANTPLTFNDRSRYLFEVGQASGGGNVAVAVGADYSGTSCTATNSVAFSGTNATLAVTDTSHQRTYVVSDTGGNAPEVITHFTTSGNYYSVGSLTRAAQASLDTGGTYTSMVVDTFGDKGYVAVTQLRTNTSAGGLWVYDPTFGRTVKVMGPGGKALPAVGSFILHNPQSIGGSLLVLVNQDNLSAATIASPTPVSTPFTLIDLGQLGLLLNQKPTATSVTLPFVTNIASNLNYYAIFGAAYNPVDGKLYLLTGGGTSTTSILKQVVRYDPSTPSSPSETPVADLAAVPLNFGDLPQIALNGSANTLQVLTSNPKSVYTVSLAAGDTAAQVTGATFGDGNFQPTFITTNPLMGETYIASGSGQVDILTLPAGKQRRGTLLLDGPNATATSNQSTSVRLQAILPVVTTADLSGTITITATAASTGQSFTFATNPMDSSLDLPRTVSGTFPADDFYTLVATWPGNANYPAVTSAPVVVAVGKPQFPTQITATAAASSSTDATASITLTGTTYAPTGTVTLKDSTGTTLKTYTLPIGSISNPISIPFTFSSGTTSITATYSGDTQNGTSTSTAATITGTATKSATTLTLTAPTSANANTSFNSVVALGSANGSVPTGQVMLYATPSGSTAGTIGSASTSAAFGAGASIAASLPNGTYTLQAKYDGDTNFSASASNSITLVVTTPTAGTVSLSPTSLTFNQAVGTTSGYQDVVISNGGGSQVTLSGIAITGTGFTQINGCGGTLAAGAKCTARITFAPAAAGTSNGTLTVRSSAANSPATVTLTGTGYNPLNLQASATTFADTTIGTSSIVRPTVTFTNNSGSNVTITQISGSNAADVEAGPGCVGAVLANGSSCTVLAIFHPGTAGSRSGNITFTVSGQTLSTPAFTGNGLAAGQCADADGDALCDDWEKNGMWSHTAGQADQFIDLPSMGADPKHKDLFIHVDWMQTAKGAVGEHSHQLKAAAQSALVSAFNASPVKNLDGTEGIHLHIDCGPTCIMNPVTKATWGSASKAAMLSEQAVLDAVVGEKATDFDWTVFDTNSAKFNATGRALVFHHTIMAHDQKAGNSTSGVSRNAAVRSEFLKGASDFNVTLGSWNNQTGTDLQQGGTLMHELGHNLSLEHGGRDEDNYKPNYLSVMNYNMQTNGVIVDGASGFVDYSRWALPSLGETKLNEKTGLNADPKTYTAQTNAPAIDHFGTYFFCLGDDFKKVGPQQSNTVNGPINWDCDKAKVISPLVVSDVNADKIATPLASNEDWFILVFSGGAVGGNGVGIAPLTVTPAAEITQEQNSLIVPPYGVAIRGMNALRTAPGTQPTLRFIVTNTGSNADTYKVTADTANGWTVAPGYTPTLTLPAGGQGEVALTYAVPATAASGDGDLLTFRVASNNAPRVTDSVEVGVYAESNPAPLAVSSASVSFPAQVTGTTSAISAVVLVNTGSVPLSFPSIATSAEFAQNNTCPAQLLPMASCRVDITFQPAGTGLRTGTLSITSSASSTPLVVTLQGMGNTAPLQRPAFALSVAGTGFTRQPVTFTVAATLAGGNTAPGGVVTLYNESTALGQITLDKSGSGSFSTTALVAGIYNLYAAYAGDTNFTPVNTPYQALTLVDTSSTSTTLKTSAAAVVFGTPVTFTATVTATTAGAATPTGAVTFYEGATSLGTGMLTNGTATLTSSTLTLGAHSVTASYGGDAVSLVSTSTSVTTTVSAAMVTLSATPSSLTVTSGTSGAVTLTATPNGTYTGAMSFSCGQLPAHTACRFSSQTLTFAASSAAQTTTLTITTRDNALALLDRQAGSSRMGNGFAIVAAVFMPLGLGGMAMAQRRRRLVAGAGLLLLLMGAFAATAGLCGCGSSAGNTTTPGTYSVPVVAVANGVASQVTVTVTVQ